MTGRGLKQRKNARQCRAGPGRGDPGATIIDHRFRKSRRFSGQSSLGTVIPLRPLEATQSGDLNTEFLYNNIYYYIFTSGWSLSRDCGGGCR
jgi:hypothetical protein